MIDRHLRELDEILHRQGGLAAHRVLVGEDGRADGPGDGPVMALHLLGGVGDEVRRDDRDRIRADLQGGLFVGLLTARGQDHDEYAIELGIAANGTTDFVAVHAWHHHIEKHDLRLAPTNGLEPFHTVAAGLDLDTLRFEDERDGLAELGPTALGYHTDPGVLTLLLQDAVGGLQADSETHGWIDVPPRPGTVVVNLGDVMQVWSNDRFRAAVHRVLPMTTTTRMSIPYFFNPARDSTIEPIAALAADTPRYRPFTWREFMGARNADNYADEGADDTQVTDFALT